MGLVFLHGPPGAGKSTVAPLVAQSLESVAIDLDEVVKMREGATASAIFASRGEEAFRAVEASALRAICTAEEDAVVALGGGALLDIASRELVSRAGTMVTLGAPVSVLARRLKGSNDRPLLAGDEGALERLCQERADLYASGHAFVDASLPAEQVASAVVEAARASLAKVHLAAAPYAARITADAARCLSEMVRVLAPTSVHVVTEERARLLVGDRVAAAVGGTVICVPPGEAAKRSSELERLSIELLRAGADRGSLLVAVGGGSVSDLVGLAAATYMRGVDWVTLPTTTLAMADAALGGKTAIDVGDAKNLVGAFWHPRAVLVQPGLNRSEPERQRRSGLAEIVKALVIGDAAAFADVELGSLDDASTFERALAAALSVKAAVVSEDPSERGWRAVLNLGHTLGHALESEAGFGPVLHGEAVAMGMVAASRVSEALGLTSPATTARIVAVLERAGLPTRPDRSLLGGALGRLRLDKKTRGGTLQLVLLRDIGAPELRRCALDEAVRVFAHVLD